MRLGRRHASPRLQQPALRTRSTRRAQRQQRLAPMRTMLRRDATHTVQHTRGTRCNAREAHGATQRSRCTRCNAHGATLVTPGLAHAIGQYWPIFRRPLSCVCGQLSTPVIGQYWSVRRRGPLDPNRGAARVPGVVVSSRLLDADRGTYVATSAKFSPLFSARPHAHGKCCRDRGSVCATLAWKRPFLTRFHAPVRA